MPQPDGKKQENGLSGRKHHDVFISYAQQDKPIADAICARLESRRIRCWISPRDVPAAKDFPAAIVEGIEESRFLVLVFSSHANNSPHVIRELTSAVNKGRIIIPFRVEDVVPSKSMEYLIGVPHWLDAITPPLEKHIESLADTIDNILAENVKGTTCSRCGAELSINAKFCESCGAMVSEKEPAPARAVEESSSPPPPPPAEKEPDTGREHPVAGAVSPEPSAQPPEAAASNRKKTGRIIGALIAAIIVVAVLFFIFVNLAGEPDTQSGPATTLPTPVATTTVDYRSEDAPVNLVVLTVQPTQELPKDLMMYIETSKDPTNAVVTVQYNGGPGGKVVQGNSVILTRSDGTVETASLDFTQRLSLVELQGTRGTDRIQVIVTMGIGTQSVIVDKLLPLRSRNID